MDSFADEHDPTLTKIFAEREQIEKSWGELVRPWWFRLIRRIGYECYWWYAEVKTAFMAGMEDAGWTPRGGE